MHRVALVALAIALCVAAEACGGSDHSSSPTPAPRTPGSASSPSAGGLPKDCESLIPSRDITDLVAANVTVANSVPVASGSTLQLQCRYSTVAGAPIQDSIVVIVAEYPDAATAAAYDAGGRAAIEAQGGTFTKLEGVGQEAYTFAFPRLTGISARNGRHTLSLGIGSGVTTASPQAVQTLAQKIVANVGP